MADQNIVQSLFGITPQNVQQQMYNAAEQQALALAQMSRSPAAASEFYGLRSAGRFGAAPLFGPSAQVQRAGDLQGIVQQVQSSGVDMSTPEGMIELANAVGTNPQFGGIATSLRQEAAKLAQEQQLTQAETFRRTALGMKALQEKPENKILPPGAVMVGPGGEVIARGEPVTPKGEQPSESLKRYNELVGLGIPQEEARRIAYNIKPAEEGVKVGFDKTGRYTNVFGEVIAPTELSKNRAGFQDGEKLLQRLNAITEKDVKNSEATIDYTQGEARKAVAGTFFGKTLEAQTKIAASQLLQQIESLPPGSASDADMRASAREFPGYSNAEALRSWVNRTKGLLESSLARQAETYGFRRKITASAPLGTQQEQTQTAGQPTTQPRATKRYNEATGQLEDIR
jgi:hypothetical protein